MTQLLGHYIINRIYKIELMNDFHENLTQHAPKVEQYDMHGQVYTIKV